MDHKKHSRPHMQQDQHPAHNMPPPEHDGKVIAPTGGIAGRAKGPMDMDYDNDDGYQ